MSELEIHFLHPDMGFSEPIKVPPAAQAGIAVGIEGGINILFWATCVNDEKSIVRHVESKLNMEDYNTIAFNPSVAKDFKILDERELGDGQGVSFSLGLSSDPETTHGKIIFVHSKT